MSSVIAVENSNLADKGTILAFTFFFVLFFVQFGRKLILNQPVDMYQIVVATLITILWFGLSLLFV